MSKDEKPAVEKLTESLLDRIAPIITHGLEKAQSDRALSFFRETILPQELAFAGSVDEETSRRWAAQFVTEVSEEMASMAPSEKWPVILKKYWASRLAPLSDAAFALARRRYRNEGDLRDAADQARDLAAKLNALADELRETAPEVFPAISSEISEAAMDCDYTVNGPPLFSIRMARWIEDEENRAGDPFDDNQ